MTILIGWLGVDSRSPASAYLMSDSQFSWPTRQGKYNYGQKLFAFNNSPDILGYCGEVLFASQMLSQLALLDNSYLLFPAHSDSSERSQIIRSQIRKQFAEYPVFARGNSSIYHISKDRKNTFHVYQYSFSVVFNTWNVEELQVHSEKSSLLFAAGSGKSDFLKLYLKYQDGDISNTSRNIFQCFCNALVSNKLPFCGGSPQMVGLFRGSKFNGIPYGIIYQHTRHFMGAPSAVLPDYNSIRWYNEEFEICDGNTMERLPHAMRQPNPNI